MGKKRVPISKRIGGDLKELGKGFGEEVAGIFSYAASEAGAHNLVKKKKRKR